MPNPENIKIFEMNDCDWWAGESREEVIAAYMADQGITRAEADGAAEISEEGMDHLQFHWDSEREKPTISFREALSRMIAEGQKFPCLFASTEF